MPNPRPYAKTSSARLAGGALACVLSLLGCGATEPPLYQGYVEGEFVRVAVPYSGTLEKIQVRRGQIIAGGAPLFVLEQENEAAARREAEARLRAAEARLANLKSGKRPAELDVIKAQMAQAIAAAQLSASELKRDEKLLADGFIAPERLDSRVATKKGDRARVAELTHQLKTAELAGRDEEIRAAAAEADAARAQLEQQSWRLAQKTAKAGEAALVFDTLYSEGEWVPAGSPVVSLLPPGNVKLRFFVPETVAGKLSLGHAVEARCDGCAAPIAATISYISPQPEFTPPVIYSNESRMKLVFLVEAEPSAQAAARLHPGQPLDVRLQ